MKLQVVLLVLGASATGASVVVHNMKVVGDLNAAAPAAPPVGSIDIELIEPNPLAGAAGYAAADNGAVDTGANIPAASTSTQATRRKQKKPVILRSPAPQPATWQNAASATPAARDINKEIRSALLDQSIGNVADNSFSSLLLSAIKSSNGDLAIVSL
ncbi:hypothetical protein GGI04_000718 [Coemansia thaxteri]|uniref:Uncharacterized protein n=1 Tax=Coemansia thaxteri TaxID=2663907 RepID=A0A9W8ELW0_9FUNG|nr:hypothetical protein H4R26_000683 [Coemansia thaxteri]KAJ2009117.1 hypothetical protein GGI04_000718 [Coemansia thaxteri]KAJ2474052.1 hypothetical protein GGI02_000398 [Coemansia sp. RSA 2322]KAJ2486923.1 hypothetical protein EV174_000823 [Coemansia sp. RSA 2320]